MITSSFSSLVAKVADCDRLLVATDFDGVLAPIVDDPAAVAGRPASLDALRRLAEASNTDVAVISGRGLGLLTELVQPTEPMTLIGSHGAEFGGSDRTSKEDRMLADAIEELDGLVAAYPGLHVERKAMGVAAHFRRVTDGHAEASASVEPLCERWADDGGKVIRGKEVVEFALRHASKGDAVMTLVRRLDASVTVYLGDDTTDEDVFAVLGDDDLGIKVGDGQTLATERLATPEDVELFLVALADARSGHPNP